MTREQALEAALNAIAVRASCAPNDDAERAGEEFAKIMHMAYAAIETPPDRQGLSPR